MDRDKSRWGGHDSPDQAVRKRDHNGLFIPNGQFSQGGGNASRSLNKRVVFFINCL
jgi:hypothetical protein